MHNIYIYIYAVHITIIILCYIYLVIRPSHIITLMYIECRNGDDGVLHSTHDRVCSGGGPDARSVNGLVIYCSRRVLQVAVLSRNSSRGDGKHYDIVGRRKKIRLPRQNYAYIGVNRPRRHLPMIGTSAHAHDIYYTVVCLLKGETCSKLIVEFLQRMVYRIITHL